MDPVSESRLKLLPILQAWAKELQPAYPNVLVQVWDSPVGQLTEWQGHDFGIECLFKDVGTHESDNVSLSIVLSHLDKAPMIESADVVWGHPDGHVEVSIVPAPVSFSEESFGAVLARLPDLFAAPERAVKHGGPPAR